MKVLLRQTVDKLGYVGDVVNVRPGYARNHLLPQGLAMEPTKANLKSIEAAKQAYLQQLAQQQAELEARAKLLDGKEITIAARANEEGHLYGSVGPAQIVEALDSEGFSIEAENVMLDEPISKVDKYEVTIRFSKDVSATIGVWVVPLGDSGGEADPEGPDAASDETETVSESDNDSQQQPDAKED